MTNFKRNTLILLIKSWLIYLVIGLVSCKKKDIGTPGENEIFLLYKTFSPTSLSIKKGTTIKFTNKDNANHSVTSGNGVLNSGKIKSEDSYSYTFDNIGSYYFYCNYHSDNKQENGVIIVQ